MDLIEEKKKIILQLMNDKHYVPMKFKELVVILNVRKEDRGLLDIVLTELLNEGKITISKKGKYSIPQEEYRQGLFIGNEKGFGFVEVEGEEEDYFIPKGNVNGAFHHDMVLIAVDPIQTGKRKEGKVIKIISHEIREVVGYFQKNKSFGYVIPDNKKIFSDIYIAGKDTKGAVDGHKVVAKIKTYGTKDRKPEGVVTEILGHVNDPGVDILSIVKNYDIPCEFPEEVMEQIENIPSEVEEEDKTGDKGMPDYTVAKDFKVVWNHRQDAKASPNSTFSASVNFSTSSYERSNINNLYNSQLLTQNTKTSSISYSRSFPDIGLTLSGTTNIAQTMRDSSIAVTLPDLNITLSRLFPFKRKKAAGAERWYEKISVSYTGRLTNSIRTKDDRLFKTGISGWENAMNHNIPVSATFTLFKYLQVNPSVNYTERWYTRKINQTYNEETGRLEQNLNDTINGFYRVSNYSASLSLSTKLYGMYKPLFMKKKEIQIRHVVTPQVGISGAPAFSKYWEEYTDNNGNTQYYSPYTGQPFGVPSREGSGTVSFSIANNLEMKYYDAKKDTLKKVSLIDDLSVNMSYNMAAKEKPWSPLSMNLRLKLTKNYTFNMNASFATYAYTFDKSGNVVEGNRTEWSYGRFGRFQGYGSSFNYTFNNDTWKKWFGPKEDEKDKDKKESEDGDGEDSEGTEDGTTTKKVEKAQADPDGYQVFKMPWSLSFSYSFNIREDRTKPINRYSMRYPFTYTHNINMNGNVKISNNWSLSFNSGYDFQAKEITQTSCTISRDLHCFNLSASLSPFGRWKYYNVTIRANASILQDLKYEQRSQTQSNIQWY